MKIAITYTSTEEKHLNYCNWLQAEDGNIEFVTLSFKENNLDLLNSCDAFVLTGGVDIYPTYYNNEKLDYDNAPVLFKKDRDDFEIRAYAMSTQLRLPILGVCRGMQLINVIANGTLKQDLGNDLNKIHWAENKSHDKVHGAGIIDHTLLKSITDMDRAVVNSAHHQAIDVLGQGLMANCISDDGTIEGIEWIDKTNKPFLLAVQWHPERMYKYQIQDQPTAKKIRNYYIEEIKKNIAKK